MPIIRETSSPSVGGRPDGGSTVKHDFGEAYNLGEEIKQLLHQHGLNTIESLLRENGLTLRRLGFKVGHIAELSWALEKALLERRRPIATTRNKDYTPSIQGGTGGSGGDGLRRGGRGGIGQPPEIAIEDVFRFSEIRGGTGGSGGETGVRSSSVEKNQRTATLSTPALSGGTGGDGGYGAQFGGLGGCGEAAQIAAEDVAHFRTITGGFGGAGGGSGNEGGYGGTGEGPKFARSLSIDIADETRLRVPDTTIEELKDFGIHERLCKLLKAQGFRTVGGLFEAVDELSREPLTLSLGDLDFSRPMFTGKHSLGTYLTVFVDAIHADGFN
ncbi:hypothetical protein K438DRAFT_1765211 [Mycena galopus ATCC 62051]|nr:hypothetical protein K438DRAFT_1765211 [Mycena galopus ATCC 62051]